MNLTAWYRSRRHIPGRKEKRSASSWKKSEKPERILIIRFHAVGDVALTLPYCLGLRRLFPDARIDLLTSPEPAPLANAIRVFDGVHLLQRAPKKGKDLSALVSLALRLRAEQYQIVLDLQRNWRSRWIRRIIRPQAVAEFDRFSPHPACERTMQVFHEAGLSAVRAHFKPEITEEPLGRAEQMLRSHGWYPGEPLVLLNPAGLWDTRRWPLQNYADLALLWPDRMARFLLIGTERLRAGADVLADRLGGRLIDLAGQTTLDTAFALLRFVDLAITEDSGLMHMAWSLGTPIIALFGSSRHSWSLPVGEHVRAFHSGDLPCAACMQERCRYGDNHCLTRVTPQMVLRAAQTLMPLKENAGQ